MRPISNIVDVTNYVMLSLGQPLHAFDFDTLEEGKIVVRRWRPGDGPFATLDGQERRMNEDDLMICDAARPVAIGGVMGGLNSEIGDSTENILLESAYFSPLTIRSTRRRLNISTESSYRFERGVDPTGTRRAADWAIELIRQSAGGRTAPGAVDARPGPHEPLRVSLRAKRAADILGMEVEPKLIRRELEALGMKMGKSRNKDVLEVEVPAFRHDIEREIDLIEEVARRIGYGAIPSTLPRTAAPPGRLSDLARLEREAREAMISSGFDEALNYSFQSRADLEQLGAAGADLVPLQNPLSAEMDVMRTTLLAGLLRNAGLNLNRGAGEVRMFEAGRTFHARAGEKLPREVARIAAIASESAAPSLWPEAPSPGGEIALPGRLFDLKGVLERMGRILHFPEFRFSGEEGAGPAFERGAAAPVYVNGTLAGAFGQIERAVLDNFGIREKIYAFEVDLGALAATPRPPLRFRALPRFPASLRDLAIVVKEEIAQEAAGEAIREAGGELLETADLFDIYRDSALAAEGEKSLAYSLVFRHTDRTLNDKEVDEVFGRILGSLEERLGARLRS
jgi:phenylalanyl-tRNA synthetase beta chain